MSRGSELPKIGEGVQRSDKKFGRGREHPVTLDFDGRTVPPNTRNSRRRAQEKKQRKKAQSPGEKPGQKPKEHPQSRERRQRGPRT